MWDQLLHCVIGEGWAWNIFVGKAFISFCPPYSSLLQLSHTAATVYGLVGYNPSAPNNSSHFMEGSGIGKPMMGRLLRRFPVKFLKRAGNTLRACVFMFILYIVLFVLPLGGRLKTANVE